MTLRIRVFDDDPDICKMLQTAFKSKDYEVTTHSDPTEFPFFTSDKCPCTDASSCADVLIADIVMPNIEGIDFLKKLKERGCVAIENKNVAIMSGFLTIHYMKELNDMGIHYFRKPFKIKEIYSWIDQCQKRLAVLQDS